MRKAIFLDKDGTLIDDVSYSVDPDLVTFRPGAIQALHSFQNAGFALVIVSNQSGVARGKFTQADLDNLIEQIAGRLSREGIDLDGFYCCTHGPDDGCVCRKPAHGLLLNAAEDLDICLTDSWMVGDRRSDMIAGKAAGCRTVQISEEFSLLDAAHDIVLDDLLIRTGQPTGLDAQLARIEAKLDTLIAALADDEDEPIGSLDGSIGGRERDQSRPL